MGQITATTTFEVEVDLSGSLQPAQRQTMTDPGHDAFVEDVAVDGLCGLRRNGGYWTRVNLLAGMDPASPCTKALIANLQDFVGESADEALMAEASA